MVGLHVGALRKVQMELPEVFCEANTVGSKRDVIGQYQPGRRRGGRIGELAFKRADQTLELLDFASHGGQALNLRLAVCALGL